MKQVTISDLLSLDSPAVVRAMTIKCGMCGAPKGQRCRSLNPGYVMATVTHFARATEFYEKEAA